MFITKKTYKAIVDNTRKIESQLVTIVNAAEDLRTLNSAKRYRSKSQQVAGLRKKYQAVDTWGNVLLQRLVNLRVAFSVPNRLFIIKNPNTRGTKEELTAVKEFLNTFMEFNGLAGKLPRDFAIESELQGQVLVELVWDAKYKIPALNYYPWSSTGYTVKPHNKYGVRSELDVLLTLGGTAHNLVDENCVFIAFNDELTSYIGYPTCGGILTEIENISKDLDDWRKLNHLYAHPTPHFECETQEEADKINTQIKGSGWRVGTAIATKGAFNLKGPTGAEANLLMLSIQTSAKIISGHTGLGIHFLGFPNVMSNRAVADSIGEPTEVVLHSEITSWQDFYNCMFIKAIKMRNKKLNKPLRTDIVWPKIVPITDRQWDLIKDVFLKLNEEGLISDESLLDRLPDVDAEFELERIKEQEAQGNIRRERNRTNNRIGTASSNDDSVADTNKTNINDDYTEENIG